MWNFVVNKMHTVIDPSTFKPKLRLVFEAHVDVDSVATGHLTQEEYFYALGKQLDEAAKKYKTFVRTSS